MPPAVDELVAGKYRIVRSLGEGGMGSVFEAVHEGLGTRVALKFLKAELAHREDVQQRFVQEAQLVACIKSPHVVAVFDVEPAAEGGLFMVLEYLEGKTLQERYRELARTRSRFSWPEAVAMTLQMLEGADAAHRAGVIHRDLKPDNVMIVAGAHGEPFIKLLDFGIAKLRATGSFAPGMTRPGVVMGTPEYMAPEQVFASDAVDARADIFAIGVMAFEMLAGVRPLAGDDPQSLAAAHLAGKAARLSEIETSLPPGLAVVVERAMAPRTRDRFGTAADFFNALLPFAAPASAWGPTAQTPPGDTRVSDPPFASDRIIDESTKDAVPTTRPAQEVKTFVTAKSDAKTALLTGFPGDQTAPWDPKSEAATTAFPTPPPPEAAAPSAPAVPPAAAEPAPAFVPVYPPAFDGTLGSASSPGPTAPGSTAPGSAPPAPEASVVDVVQPKPLARASWCGGPMGIALMIGFGVIVAIGVGIYVAWPTHADDEVRHPQHGATGPKRPKRH